MQNIKTKLLTLQRFPYFLILAIFPLNPQGEQKELSHKRLGKHKSLVLKFISS